MTKLINISDLSKSLDLVNPITKKPLNHILRFWEKEFKEIQPKKKQSGARKYTSKDIIIIEKIYFLLKKKGLTIEGAKKQLKIKSSVDGNHQLIIQKLEIIKANLEFIKDKI